MTDHRPDQQAELDRLVTDGLRGIKDFLEAGGEGHKIDAEAVTKALQAEIAAPMPKFGQGQESPQSQAILDKLATNSNPNTVQVVKKIFKSTRLAAMSLRGQAAAYQDIPLMSEEDRRKMEEGS